MYKKTVSRTTRYKVHDEDNSCRVGDRVRISETRPLSRHKRWAIAEVLSHSAKAETEAAKAEASAARAEAAQEEVSK
jgi:Ribosomal protein S17